MKWWHWIMYRTFGIKRKNPPLEPNREVKSIVPDSDVWNGDKGIEPEKFKFEDKKKGFFS